MEVRFTAKEEADLARLAAQEGTDLEKLVRGAALRLIKDDARFRAAVERGLREADAGELIEEEEMDARVERMLRS